MAAQEIPIAGFRTKLLSRSSVAEGTVFPGGAVSRTLALVRGAPQHI
jgi:hypothetical protein